MSKNEQLLQALKNNNASLMQELLKTQLSDTNQENIGTTQTQTKAKLTREEVTLHNAKSLGSLLGQSLTKEEINAKDKNGRTLLHLALLNKDSFLALALIEAGADVNARDAQNNTPLHYEMSTWSGSQIEERKIATKLVEKGADLSLENADGKTAIECYRENKKVVLKSADFINDLKTVSKEDATFYHKDQDINKLFEAVAKSNPGQLGRLLGNRSLSENVAFLQTGVEGGKTPLHIVAKNGDPRVFKKLMEIVDSYNNYQYKDAVQKNESRGSSEYSNEPKVQPDYFTFSQDKFGRTPVHYAAQSGNIDVIIGFREQGASINSSDKNKNTPLHCVKTPEAAIYLIKEGANLGAKNKLGQNPLDVAISNNWEGVVEELLKAGAKSDTLHECYEFSENSKIVQLLEKREEYIKKTPKELTELVLSSPEEERKLIEGARIAQNKDGFAFGKGTGVYNTIMSATPEDLAKQFTANSYDKKGLFAGKKSELNLDAIMENCPLEVLEQLKKVDKEIEGINKKKQSHSAPRKAYEAVKNALSSMVNYITSPFTKPNKDMDTLLKGFKEVSKQANVTSQPEKSNGIESKIKASDLAELSALKKVFEKNKNSVTPNIKPSTSSMRTSKESISI